MTAIVVMAVGGVIAVSVVATMLVFKRARPESRPPSDPMRILEVRLARGEITADEYDEQRSRLSPPPSPGAHHRGASTADDLHGS